MTTGGGGGRPQAADPAPLLALCDQLQAAVLSPSNSDDRKDRSRPGGTPAAITPAAVGCLVRAIGCRHLADETTCSVLATVASLLKQGDEAVRQLLASSGMAGAMLEHLRDVRKHRPGFTACLLNILVVVPFLNLVSKD